MRRVEVKDMSGRDPDKFYVKAEGYNDARMKFGEWAEVHKFNVSSESLKFEYQTIEGLEIWSIEAAE